MPYIPEALLVEVIKALDDELVDRAAEVGEDKTIEQLRAAGLTGLPDRLREILGEVGSAGRSDGLARAQQLLLDISFDRGYDEHQLDDAIEAIESARITLQLRPTG